MNKTFKVVYNKARGMLTAVNEAASCVQAVGGHQKLTRFGRQS